MTRFENNFASVRMDGNMSENIADSVKQDDLVAYVDQAARIIGLEIPAEYHAGVVQNFERIAAIAQPVMEFPLPEDIEIAPIFEP
jgi:hypothetical protein